MFKLLKIAKNELIKIHIYLLHKTKTTNKYQNFINKFKKVSVEGITDKIIMFLIMPILLPFSFLAGLPFLSFFSIFDKIFNKIAEHLNKIVSKIHLLILLYMLFYDCYYNNFILEKTTKYLPIFLLLTLWITFSHFIENQNESYNMIIAERFYDTPHTVYINFNSEEEKLLNNYITVFYCPKEAFLPGDFFYENPMIINSRYWYHKSSNKYLNAENNTFFSPSSLKEVNGKYFVNKSDIIKVKMILVNDENPQDTTIIF